MSVEAGIARAFALDDIGWARHANPWSGWTRFTTCLPLLVFAAWSRIWLGWGCLAPVALAVLWIWANPRAFGPARDDSAWITRRVLEERFWAGRVKLEVPERHRKLPHVLNVVSLSGMPFVIWGLVALDLWPTAMGIVLIIGSKLWYIDRMAIHYEDIVYNSPDLRYLANSHASGLTRGR
jgi:hypothetical protein